MLPFRARFLLGCSLVSLAPACGPDDTGGERREIDAGSIHDGDAATDAARHEPIDIAAPVDLTDDALARASFEELSQLITKARGIDRASFDQQSTVATEPLGYDPLSALNLDQIQSSPFQLDTKGLDTLATHGFVIDTKHGFPDFAYGLQMVYAADMPVYITADSVLEAVHKSYDEILKAVESQALVGALRDMLSGLTERLKSGHGAVGSSRADLDLYLAVARALLDDRGPLPVAGGNQTLAAEIVAKAKAASGLVKFDFFGEPRTEDFSQFKPRGHYEGDVTLERYFRTMIWLGRLDMRLIETKENGSTVFRRRQFDAMLGLHDLFEPTTLALYEKIDGAIQEFVGESDYMTLPEVSPLLEALGAPTVADTVPLSDDVIAQTISSGGFGAQRIASHFMVTDLSVPTLPLNRSFALLGQRYVIDSHVFSNVVFDRVRERMMPNPLDVAFAVFRNDQAASYLKSELDTYDYQGALNGMRVAVEAHGDDYWDANLYNRWLLALRGLSPFARPPEVPAPMKSEGWGRRLLNTQLASWAELRHDTILYAKQSYTGAFECEFPDGYVDPYPAFYAALVAYAERGLAMSDRLEGTARADLIDRLRDHFSTLKATLTTLQHMAEQELSGVPFDAEQLAFINDAVRYAEGGGCAGPVPYDGWYPRMLFINENEFDPTIADVHTQPSDGGKVLHVGTGEPRPAVFTVNTCEGARAYVGVVFSYHEVITENFERLTDDEWSSTYRSQRPADVPWMGPVLSE